MLPIQEDSRVVSFQIDNLDTFAIDFEIFPTFGSKVIAKTVALPDVFRAVESSSGICCLPLFDPRLRAIGQIQFSFQVVKPYSGTPLEITQFATYWKATSTTDDSGALITGSSLSGDYLRLSVQMTRDAIPVIYPSYLLHYHELDASISQLNYQDLMALGPLGLASPDGTSLAGAGDIMYWRSRITQSIPTLKEVLDTIPAEISLNLNLLYPSLNEERDLGIFQSVDINRFADTILTEVFDHARALKARNTELSRSIVFSSWNPSICTAINWKQPNYAVLLCNDLGGSKDYAAVLRTSSKAKVVALPTASVKESARLAQSNNFMGLMCSSRILQRVPAIKETLKQAGLVVVSEIVDEDSAVDGSTSNLSTLTGWSTMPEGVNGVMKSNGILRFNESIDM